MKLSDNALDVLEKRYFIRDEKGNPVENWEDLCRRVTRHITQNDEKYYDEFFDLIHNLKALPNSPCLRNAGRGRGSLSACFILPVDDSRKSIFQTLSDAVQIQSSGGGTGYSFGRLRPKGAPIKSVDGKSSGPVSFMKIYDLTIGPIIAQGGVRHGAQMGVMPVNHPDILEFINCKMQEGQISNFNISVAATDKFMEAVKNDKRFSLTFGGKIYRRIKARRIWDNIIHNAWRNGEPGLIFIDMVSRRSMVGYLGPIESTNPCSEVGGPPYYACILMSINLFNMLKNGDVDWELLADTSRLCTRFLNAVIDHNNYMLDPIARVVDEVRPIGLGIMGLADVFLIKEIPYGSKESLKLASRIMEHVDYYSKLESVEMAKEKGPFKGYKKSDIPKHGFKRENTTLDWDYLNAEIKKHGIYNCQTTTVAPTGTLSMLAGVSSGIEPNFSFEYAAHRVGKEYHIVNRVWDDYRKKHKLKASFNELVKQNGIIPSYFITAEHVSPEEHVKMQATIQKFVDNGVSKTVNLPSEASPEVVSQVYMAAYDLGCNGITVYRNGSREVQVLVDKENKKNGKRSQVYFKPRPEVSKSITFRETTGCGHTTVNVTKDWETEEPFEVFVTPGLSSGGCAALTAGLGRIVSLALRCGIPAELVVDQLSSVRCPASIRNPNCKYRSCPDMVGRKLAEASKIEIKVPQYENGELKVHYTKTELHPKSVKKRNERKEGMKKADSVLIYSDTGHEALNIGVEGRIHSDKCHECGYKNKFFYEGGCRVCMNCGFSHCS